MSNATKTFQRMTDRTTDGLEGVFAHMDNSRAGSPDRQTHLCHLEAFFTALAANGLAINLEIFFSPLYVYSDFNLKCIHTRHSYRAFIHHSVAPIILLRSNIFGLDRHNIQIREYLLGSFYSWDTI
jgi:hypothetical protein